jgi:hypothetical protein
MPASFARVATAAVLVVVAAACGVPPSAAPETSTTPSPEAAPAFILGCTSIASAECRFVVEAVLAKVPPERGNPISVQITLYGCPVAPGCARSLATREGEAIIDLADGGDPLMFALAGPPDTPRITEAEIAWSGRLVPQSPPAGGPGPFPFEVGHCGLWNSVDFDTSWWVPIGEVDGDIPAMINSEQGRVRLLTPTNAEYLSPAGARVTLARFPGAKHLRLCL